MDETVPFEKNQRLRLSILNFNRSLVAHIRSASTNNLWLQLAEPSLGLEPHHLEQDVQVSFWRDGSLHNSEVNVLATYLDSGEIQVTRPKRTKIMQRRQTFREIVSVPVTVTSAIADPETMDLEAQKVTTQDLGGGGLCVQASESMNMRVNEEIQLEIQLPEHHVKARGCVRWCDQTQDGRILYGIAFTRIAEREQDFVYGFLFNLQRNRLRPTS